MTSKTSTTTAAPSVETADEWAAKIARLRTRPPAEDWLTVPDEDAVRAVEVARNALYRARSKARDEAPAGLSADEVTALIVADKAVKAAERDLNKKITAAQEGETTFHFRAMPPDVYDALLLEFPPTAEQQEMGLTFDAVRWVPALIARSSVKPLTEEQVRGLIYPHTDDDGVEHPPPFTQGDVSALVSSCRNLNERPRLMLGKGSRPTAG